MIEAPLYRVIARTLVAMRNCEKNGNDEWYDKHRERIEQLTREHMPRGSGFDNGTHFDFGRSEPNRLVWLTSFHHMNEGGFYTHWTEHTVTVKPDLSSGYALRVTRDPDDYVCEEIGYSLDIILKD